jgi:putative phosphoribosyl transferase
MRAAVAALRRQGPARIVVAVPIGASETCSEVEREADEVICAVTPQPFYAVGVWYVDFSQTTDEEVRELLARAGRDHETPGELVLGAPRAAAEGEAEHARREPDRAD